MKLSLALGPRQPLSRQTAWGCLTTNLAMPGFGSLMAGRSSGYLQALLGLAGMGLTLVFGLRFVLWFFANYARFHQAQADPLANLEQLWLAVRWALLGIFLFLLGWCWGLITGLQIVAAAKKAEQARVPPRLGSGPP